jgi:hypothetical protein
MKLRSYKTYLKKLKQYCKVSNVKIVWKSNYEGCGDYDPNNRTITIDRKLSQSEIISTMLHELGHYLDDSRNPTKYGNNHHYYGRTRLERELSELTTNQKAIVWDTELEAWKNAEALAYQLRIPLSKWYWKDKESSLNTYRSIRIES